MSAQVDVQLKDFSTIFSLEGKVAVVTGGSRGLGLHAASGYVIIAAYSGYAGHSSAIDCPTNWAFCLPIHAISRISKARLTYPRAV
jgi:hypothetical protein